ncbi:MAG: ribonuclease H-like YkuK family protein [Candidatus Paceibacterota bacterium]|jgi:hypothetical protein
MSYFIGAQGKQFAPTEVAKEIISFMEADNKRSYRIVVGTDSLLLADKTADFVTAVVVHRVGNGGKYFWKRQSFKNFYTLRDRILKEVILSIDLAKEVLLDLKNLKAPDFNFEIHVDIGTNGPTNEMMQEVIGMIRAYNFEVKTKPDSYAASKVADRHV